LADVLRQQREVGRTVIDETGLKGKYDWTLQWTPDQGQSAVFKGGESGQAATFNGDAGGHAPNSGPPPDTAGPSIFTALQEQLGLKLESQKGPVEILVIDHVEKPSEN
jgi:uncharacterized protein (TIGR03435 family)